MKIFHDMADGNFLKSLSAIMFGGSFLKGIFITDAALPWKSDNPDSKTHREHIEQGVLYDLWNVASKTFSKKYVAFRDLQELKTSLVLASRFSR